MTAQQPPHTHPHRAPLPTPRTATVSRTRPTSTSAAAHRAPIPPHAPKPSRGRRPIDPTATTTASTTTQTNPLFSLPPQPHSLVPRASCGKPDDLLAPPDAQSCPFAKAGLKVLRGMGAGAYGELDGWLEWPPELFAAERIVPRFEFSGFGFGGWR